jgi:16S rRNA (cytosine967-C5)-methyltransferase
MAESALFGALLPDLPRGVARDCPDWLLPLFDEVLGDDCDAVLDLMRERAPVFIRVNTARAHPEAVQKDLARDGIETCPHPLAETALEVTANPRRLRNAEAVAQGRVEMQDVASQAIALDFAQALPEGVAVLDYCAGGGGKALALAARGFQVSAHDANPARMRDLPGRAARAGAPIRVLEGAPHGAWPAIFADAPCSGSGSWRRAPEAKWAFTPERLAELTRVQDQILHECAALTEPGGLLGYATCSMLRAENTARVEAFLATHPGWTCEMQRSLTPLEGGDGFFVALLRRSR